MIIAIDGPAGSGKSTVAQAVAQALGLAYFDTGAMYRAVALKALREDCDLNDAAALVAVARAAEIAWGGFRPSPEGAPEQEVRLDGEDVTSLIRTPEVTAAAAQVAATAPVRQVLVAKQRALGAQCDAVLEGRDIGTVVFPAADFKFYFDADLGVRAQRRARELERRGCATTVAAQRRDIERRDGADAKRTEGPLARAPDAELIDTTRLSVEQVVAHILQKVRARGRAR